MATTTNYSVLPTDIQQKLQELELELAEGLISNDSSLLFEYLLL